MPRTVNTEVRQVRRDAFLDAAQRLIQAKGYEAMSIQDVLDEVDTSRGALYHYFDSKEALLDGVVERFADAALAQVEPILADPSLPALAKLEKILAGVATFKADSVDLVLAILRVWMSDGNAVTRDKVRRLSARRVGPILSEIVRQGVAEGTLTSTWPDETARVLLLLVLSYQELAGEQFIARKAGTIGFEEVLRAHAAFTEAFERILGAAPGSVRLTDEATLRFWFE